MVAWAGKINTVSMALLQGHTVFTSTLSSQDGTDGEAFHFYKPNCAMCDQKKKNFFSFFLFF